jgi:hypothetical protein
MGSYGSVVMATLYRVFYLPEKKGYAFYGGRVRKQEPREEGSCLDV